MFATFAAAGHFEGKVKFLEVDCIDGGKKAAAFCGKHGVCVGVCVRGHQALLNRSYAAYLCCLPGGQTVFGMPYLCDDR